MITDEQRAESMGDATREKLKQFIARIERLEAEKAELAADIREVYSELKTFGFDTKVIRKLVSLRRIEAHERAEMDALTELYMSAVEGTFEAPKTNVTIVLSDGSHKVIETETGNSANFFHEGLFFMWHSKGVYKQV